MEKIKIRSRLILQKWLETLNRNGSVVRDPSVLPIFQTTAITTMNDGARATILATTTKNQI